ncbi:hypothetical protein WICPIJ_004147 [Wickerhamomyces pijperi]|uniref:Uncharacterized protein n=1 Tax=Wickerhamomyces pijperi TaxID=599730 RepID=A0A9P8Q899_WICPI|nr:hypothetical protein WICPIJ_004147 [Wickerhamomyces pijperi]
MSCLNGSNWITESNKDSIVLTRMESFEYKSNGMVAAMIKLVCVLVSAFNLWMNGKTSVSVVSIGEYIAGFKNDGIISLTILSFCCSSTCNSCL